MSELINFILSTQQSPESPNAEFWSGFIDFSGKNKTITEEELNRRLIDV